MLIYRKNQINATDNSGVAIAVAEGVACIMEGVDGGGTCGVNRKTASGRSAYDTDYQLLTLDKGVNGAKPGVSRSGPGLMTDLGPFRLNTLPMRLLIMPGSTPVAA